MAVKIKNPATLIDIKNAIHSWLDLLADEKYRDAYAFTLHDPYYEWTPELLEQVINGYGLPYENDGSPKYKVTKWSTAINEDNCRYNEEITFFDKPRDYSSQNLLEIGEVYYNLPLDGEWSDLTATVIILQSADFTTLELNEIHVM